jgi:SAM-dependent methyltransferase
VTLIDSWLAANWSFVREQLPQAPATVLEIGCGPRGGFVPLLLGAGYDAVGVDPEAPAGPSYHRIDFECYEPPRKVDAVVACTSLHHVRDVANVLDRVTDCLKPRGAVVVVEWDWERFDEKTALWCFARLASIAAEPSEHGWLRTIHDEWAASGQSWQHYWRGWADREGLHRGEEILSELNRRYDCRSCIRSPNFYPDLDAITETDEQAAIDRGQIQAGGIRFVGYARHPADTK